MQTSLYSYSPNTYQFTGILHLHPLAPTLLPHFYQCPSIINHIFTWTGNVNVYNHRRENRAVLTMSGLGQVAHWETSIREAVSP